MKYCAKFFVSVRYVVEIIRYLLYIIQEIVFFSAVFVVSCFTYLYLGAVVIIVVMWVGCCMESVNPVLLQKIVEYTIDTNKAVADSVFNDEYLIIKSLNDAQFKEQLYSAYFQPRESSIPARDFENAVISRKESISKIVLDVRNKDAGGTSDTLSNSRTTSLYTKNYVFSRKILSKNDESIVQRIAEMEEEIHPNT